MKSTNQKRIAVLLLCMCLAAPISGLSEDDAWLRGSIIDLNGNMLAYTDPDTLERVYPFGDQLKEIIGDVQGGEPAVQRGVGGIEESMDWLLYQGNEHYTIQLTLDMDLQKIADDALEALISQSTAPDAKGSAVVMDMQGRVLVMASANKRPSNAHVSNAISLRSAPGELFLPVTALAALVNDELSVTETISDEGLYDLYPDHPARCWIAPDKVRQHAHQTAVEGISHTCDYFFYVLGSRLGMDGERLVRFSREIGLSDETRIELPQESDSIVASQATLYAPLAGQYTRIPAFVFETLCDLVAQHATKHGVELTTADLQGCVERIMQMAYEREQGVDQEVWRQYIAIFLEESGFTHEQATDTSLIDPMMEQLERIKYDAGDMLEAVVGQSVTQVTPIAIARFMTTIANGGDVYPASIIESIAEREEGVVDRYSYRTPDRVLSAEIGEYLPYIHMGFRGVVDRTAKARNHCNEWQYLDQVVSMVSSGKSCETGEVNSLWYAGFAPYDNPEIVVVVNLVDGDANTDEVFPVGKELFDTYLSR